MTDEARGIECPGEPRLDVRASTITKCCFVGSMGIDCVPVVRIIRCVVLLSLLSCKVIVVESSDTQIFQKQSISPTKSSLRVGVNILSTDLSKVIACQEPIATATHSKRDSSYTRNWSHEDWGAHIVSPVERYLKHLKNWVKSPTAAAVVPMVGLVSMWAVLTILVQQRWPSFAEFLRASSSATAIGGFSVPLALILTLRTNRALDRLMETRRAWGKLMNSCSSLASLIVTHVSPRDSDLALIIARYIGSLGWMFKGFFMNEDEKPVLTCVLPADEASWMAATLSDAPSSVLLRLRALLATLQLDIAPSQAIENRLNEIEVSLGICKRILGSPIPPTFSRHLSRVLCLYLALLPMILVGAGVPPKAVVFNVTLVAYVFIGLDEIGVEIEHPFRMLPLCSLSATLQRNVANIFASYLLMTET